MMWFYIVIPGLITFSHLAAANHTINLANVSLGKPGLPILVRWWVVGRLGLSK